MRQPLGKQYVRVKPSHPQFFLVLLVLCQKNLSDGVKRVPVLSYCAV